MARNRLAEEKSPYLQQHADNPVDWQPWDSSALEEARERDVPIFLSIGYSACHWCHVMEDESFMDEGVAELLNNEFVPIKVDREERPDLDRIYQTACQLFTGRGGWPLSAFLTPDGRPFYVGTYFPTEAKRGQPGFIDVLEQLSEAWENSRDEVEERADKWTDRLRNQLEDTPGEGERESPDSDVLLTAAGQAVDEADRTNGGFGGAPKFPQTPRLHILLRAYSRSGKDVFLKIVEEALDGMMDGGIRDHVGGGFHRYATDSEWVVPHFEKMLYDNAEIPRAYLAGYQVTGREVYAEVAREAFEFVEREMTSKEGGFYSTLDARSERDGVQEEGAYYVWTPDELHKVLEDPALFLERFGVTETGNFEGRNVLTIDSSYQEIADEHGLDIRDVREKLSSDLERVFEARKERPRPRRDEKILAGWNGLMISALAEGGLVLDEGYAELGAEALDFCREELWDGERLWRRYKDGEVRVPGYLEDYAFLGRGSFDHYQATGDLDSLAFSLDLAGVVVEEFWNSKEETLYFTPEDSELVTRPQEVSDASTPSSLGVALELLSICSHFTGRFNDVVEDVVKTHAPRLGVDPLQHASITLAADRYLNGSTEITVAGNLEGDWSDWIEDTYIPARLMSVRPHENDLEGVVDQLGIKEVPPIWADRGRSDEDTTVYVCKSFACSPPLTDPGEADEWLDRLG